MSPTVRNSPVAAGFAAWFPPDDATITAALRTGLIVVDTNILLSLYRYDENVTAQWFDILRTFGSRLWIPHQVMAEFWKHRDKMASHPDKTLAARNDIEKNTRALRSVYEGWIASRGRQQSPEQARWIADLDAAAQKLATDVQQAHDDHKRRFDSDPDKDQVLRSFADLTRQGPESVSIGTPFSVEQLATAKKKGDERYAKSIPPGYMDDAKNDQAKTGKDSDSKYGDYFLWEQTLIRAEGFAAPPDAEKFVVLITADLKDDWWRSYITGEESSNIRIPRPELVEEMKERAQATYVQLNPVQLLDVAAAALGVMVSDETRSSAENIIRGEWLPGVFTIKLSDGVRAQARVRAGGKHECTVLKGSTARPTMKDALTPGHVRARRQLIADGVLALQDATGLLEFTCDYEFPSPSRAGSMVTGHNVNGNIDWKDEQGRTIPEVDTDPADEQGDQQNEDLT